MLQPIPARPEYYFYNGLYFYFIFISSLFHSLVFDIYICNAVHMYVAHAHHRHPINRVHLMRTASLSSGTPGSRVTFVSFLLCRAVSVCVPDSVINLYPFAMATLSPVRLLCILFPLPSSRGSHASEKYKIIRVYINYSNIRYGS